MKQQTIVYKVSDKLKEKMVQYYEDKKREKTPPYALFQADEGGTIITLYQSGKVMFQGISADIDAKMWVEIEQNLTGTKIDMYENEKKREKEKKTREDLYSLDTIGSDEVGTGDYFGPIVVTASFVPKEQVEFLNKLGVKDSKNMDDEKIKKIGPTLIKEVTHCTYILNNESYNKYQQKGYNMNAIKAILHNKVLLKMTKEFPDCQKIVVDQFVNKNKYYEYLNKTNTKVMGITFITKAESICASVAVSSVISRYIFLKEMHKLSQKLNTPLLLGANEGVDEQAINIVKEHGINTLSTIAKLNFKNTEKIKEKIN